MLKPVGRTRRVSRPFRSRIAASAGTASPPLPRVPRVISAAAADHLAGVVAIDIVEHRLDAAAVPVALDQLDALARRPGEAGWTSANEAGAVDDEIAAPRRLHDLDHVPFGRKVMVVVIA